MLRSKFVATPPLSPPFCPSPTADSVSLSRSQRTPECQPVSVCERASASERSTDI
nr:MAG TPA: hypothetical protein [Caudoviricetes sp.]